MKSGIYDWNPETGDYWPIDLDIDALSADRVGKDRHVAKDTINDCWISTVFLTVDHSFRSDVPLLFETMIRHHVTGEWLDYQDRYSTFDEAKAGHIKACEWVRNGCHD